METLQYQTRGGIQVTRQGEPLVDPAGEIRRLVEALDEERGALLASSYEYPGRYTRWDLGFRNPPLELSARGWQFTVRALNARGERLLPTVTRVIAAQEGVQLTTQSPAAATGFVARPTRRFAEEERSKQPSVFTVIRAVIDLFFSTADPHLGLYGAFGYDLVYQFEDIPLRQERPADLRDLVLYLPDELLVVDHRLDQALRYRYDFRVAGVSTEGLPRDGQRVPYRGRRHVARSCDHEPGEYADQVRRAKEAFHRGDLFEVVPSQTFFEPCPTPPSLLFETLKLRNPSPFGFFFNLGGEHLVGASPEMFVRVQGDRVETCPISGTIARGRNPLEDAEQIRKLLNSSKDETELTMCTDVDRNDKSRICVPGSVRVVGRRQIEMYSRLIHTVDHVEGRLREGFDAIDAFLTHTWAVTVTGAPKRWAMRFIEEHERSPRVWYGGAVGYLGFDGNLNTGLTLRTIRIVDGVAEVRAGATLLYDSDPQEEERETRLKAAALLDAIRSPGLRPVTTPGLPPVPGRARRVLLVDHEDSFVHTLANYLRQTGAQVMTLRAGFEPALLDEWQPDLVVLSPGPGRPSDFALDATISACLARDLPLFGVCLGLQGVVEHFGGKLGILPAPVHGKASCIFSRGQGIFQGLPQIFTAGRYHSLYALRDHVPDCLHVLAESEDGVIMALQHAELPVAAVQFHPESIMSSQDDFGLKLIHNVVMQLTGQVKTMEEVANQ